MTLRSARFNADGGITDEQLIDELTCDCCQTDVALAADGPVLAYRDRTAMEIRDIAVARLADGGWTPPRSLGSDRWQIAGCPVNGPAVSAQGAHVAVAWFTAANEQPRVRLALSQDSGRTFSAPIEIDGGKVEGRVDVTCLEGGDIAVSWLAKSGSGGAELRVRIVSARGQGAGPMSVLAETELSRSAGFPQMAAGPEGLVFAWTEPGQPSRVRTVAVSTPGAQAE